MRVMWESVMRIGKWTVSLVRWGVRFEPDRPAPAWAELLPLPSRNGQPLYLYPTGNNTAFPKYYPEENFKKWWEEVCKHMSKRDALKRFEEVRPVGRI